MEDTGQAVVNIGMLGHVDHGKTSLTKALTGKWTDTFSEEIKRGITIRIGYADVSFYKCGDKYQTKAECSNGKKGKFVRKVSFLDAPGHETLMATTIAASAIIDGAVLVIAANEPCPQPQTKEHLMVLHALNIKNIVVVQNKIDLVSKDKAKENYEQIKKFLEEFDVDAPIIPTSANYGINLDVLIEAIENIIPTPKKDKTKPPRMYVTRSFDINKPGKPIKELVGGILGGSLLQGKLQVGDKIELSPGVEYNGKYTPLITEVTSLFAGDNKRDVVYPGGLVAIGTKLDPALTKSDSMLGQMVGQPGTLPEPTDIIKVKYSLFGRTDFENNPFKKGEPLVLSVGTASTVGIVADIKKNEVTLKLKRKICADKDNIAALSRLVKQRWRLSAYGKVKKNFD